MALKQLHLDDLEKTPIEPVISQDSIPTGAVSNSKIANGSVTINKLEYSIFNKISSINSNSSLNLYDKLKINKHFISGNIGEKINKEGSNPNFRYYELQVEYNKTYLIKGFGYFIVETDNNDIIINKIGDGLTNYKNGYVYKPNINTTKAYIHFDVNEMDLETFMIVDLDYLPCNFYNKNNDEKGVYYNGTINNKVNKFTNNDYVAQIIELTPKTTYTITGFHFFLIFLDKNDNIKRKIGNGNTEYNNFTFSLENDENKVIIQYDKWHFNSNTYMLFLGERMPNCYIPYNYVLPFKLNDFNKLYEVGINKTFNKLTDALIALCLDNNDKIINIYTGTYDIFNEIGGSNFALNLTSNDAWYSVNAVVPNNTTINGIGSVTLIMDPSVSEINNIAAKILAPLNVRGNVNVNNITITANRCRYCIHDETSGLDEFDYTTHKYSNVYLTKYNSGDLGYNQAFGCGFGKGCNYIFNNCYFENGYECFSMHDWSDCTIDTSSLIVMSGCVFNTSGSYDSPSIRFGSSWKEKPAKHIVKINNCNLTKKLFLTAEGSGVSTSNNYDITIMNSGNITIQDNTTNVNYPVKIFNK